METEVVTMARQLEPRERADRVTEELRILSPLVDMYKRWAAEDVQDLVDGLVIETRATSLAMMLDGLSTRFDYVKAALQARHDAQDAEIVDHMGFDPFTDSEG